MKSDFRSLAAAVPVQLDPGRPRCGAIEFIPSALEVMCVLLTVLFGLALVATGCGPPPGVRAVESKAQALVAKTATTNEVAMAFQRNPIHIYTRDEAAQFLKRTNPHDSSVHKLWERLSKHPNTHSFPMPGGEILIFFDDSGRAVGYFSNIQL
jgi:hypothetical protein